MKILSIDRSNISHKAYFKPNEHFRDLYTKSAKTKELLYLKSQNEKIAQLLKASQIWFAKKTVELQIALDCKMWLVGYSEVKNKGIFEDYKKTLLEEYQKTEKGKNAYQKFFVYQHFSMNRFLIDLKEFSENYPQPLSEENLETRLDELGKFRKNQIFGE